MKIYIEVNSCDRRALDASVLKEYFRLNNCSIVSTPAVADFIIFVTCAFKEHVVDKNFEIINELKKYRGELIVVGCLPGVAPRRFKEEFNGRFIMTKDLCEIDKLFNNFKLKFKDVPDAHSVFTSQPALLAKFLKEFQFSGYFLKKCLSFAKRKAFDFKSYTKSQKNHLRIVYLRVSKGCIENCAYCSIRRAIGELKSKPIDLCLKEYKNLLKNGFRIFTIAADNTGAYGLDINSSFGKLLEELSTVDKGMDVKWQIVGFHPHWVIKYKSILLKLIKENKLITLACPTQSGSNRILGLMNRYYNIEDITELLLEFKEANPNLYLHTQVIIGFPSETNSDFFATLNTIKKIKFNSVGLHQYYDAEDTIASKMANKIDRKTIIERLKFARENLREEGIEWVGEENLEL